MPHYQAHLDYLYYWRNVQHWSLVPGSTSSLDRFARLAWTTEQLVRSLLLCSSALSWAVAGMHLAALRRWRCLLPWSADVLCGALRCCAVLCCAVRCGAAVQGRAALPHGGLVVHR